MIRSQIYLTEEQKRALATASKARGVPVAELVREAVDDWLEVHQREHRLAVLQRTFGAWEERDESPDEYVDRLREQWSQRCIEPVHEAIP